MRRSRVEAAQTRQEIIKAAAALLREKGFGISVAELMSEIGLTHGGFYTHFRSKEALIAEALGIAFEESLGEWQDAIDRAKTRKGMRSLVHHYLRDSHLDTPATGCAVPMLGSEAARASPAVKASMAAGIESMIELVLAQIPRGSKQSKLEQATATVACLIGAVTMARCVNNGPTARNYLKACQSFLVDRVEPSAPKSLKRTGSQ